MAATIVTGYANAPLKQGEPPDHGFLYTGKGLDFDGVTDYIDNGVANFRSSDSLGTISMWFNISTLGRNNTLVKSADTGTDTSNIGIQVSASNQLAWYQRNAADTADSLTCGTTLVASKWYYLVVVSDGSAYTIYLDGVAETLTVAAGANNGDWFAETTLRDNFVIGALKRTATENYFDGKISNLQVWDAAWSESDVQYAYTHPEKLATNTPGTSLAESNLKLWYPMNEGNPRSPQTTVYDAVMPTTGIKDKNHGTTVFYGDEIFTQTDAQWDTTGAYTGWTYYNAGTNSGVGTIKQDNGWTLYAGRTYEFNMVIGVGHPFGAAIKSYDGAVTHVAEATYGVSTTHTITFIPASDKDGLMIDVDGHIGGLSHNPTTGSWSLKEVGIATGWTEADQQLDIPQTALMGGSRKMRMIYNSGAVLTPALSGLVDADFTMSFWASYSGATNTSWAGPSIGNGYQKGLLISAGRTLVGFTTGDPAYIQMNHTGVSADGVWHHYVLTYDLSTGVFVVYIDGSQNVTATDARAIHDTHASANKIYMPHSVSYNEGFIDECSIFDETLSLAEVQELYNDGLPLDATAHTQASNLIGYWRNNSLTTAGAWEDLSANTNHGVVTGGVDAFFQSGLQSGRDSQGMFETHPQVGGGVLTFDGVGDLVAGIGMGDVFGEESLTVSCWFKADDVSSATIQFIWGEGLYSLPNKFGFGLGIVSSNLRGAGGNNDTTVWDNLAYSISSKTWYHATLVYDKTGGTLNDNFYYLYVDGVLRDSYDTDLKPRFSGDYESYIIGCAGDHDASSNYGSFFKGQVDETMLYNRALTAAEVLKNYNHGKSKHKN